MDLSDLSPFSLFNTDRESIGALTVDQWHNLPVDPMSEAHALTYQVDGAIGSPVAASLAQATMRSTERD